MAPAVKGNGDAAAVPGQVPRPTKKQIRAHFVQSAVPMIGFGFMDNTIMIQAGNAIDLTLGVYLGLSTLSAAACGQICSDVCGVGFGGFIESTAARLGLPSAGLTEQQRRLPFVKRVALVAGCLGVTIGCSLGMLNLMFIDSRHVDELKFAAESSEAGWKVHISNELYDDCTVVRVRGPSNVEGVISSTCATVVSHDFVIKEITAERDRDDLIMTMLVTTHNKTQLEEDVLPSFSKSVLAACCSPGPLVQLSREQRVLLKRNQELQDRLTKVESELEALMITVVPKHAAS